jgi:hypothetical protein
MLSITSTELLSDISSSDPASLAVGSCVTVVSEVDGVQQSEDAGPS